MNATVIERKGSEATELTGYARAIAVAEKLKARHPNHELLRLVLKGESADMERWDRERIERFYKPPDGVAYDLTPERKVDESSFNALAEAMERAMQPVPTVDVERVRVFLDPAVDVFNITLTQATPPGIWTHTAPSEAHLNAFFDGAKAMAGCLGFFFNPPGIPSDWRCKKAFLEPEEHEPAPAENVEPGPGFDRDFPL